MAFAAPARPEVQEEDLSAKIRQRDLSRLDRAPAEVGRRGAGRIALEVEWLEEPSHVLGRDRTALGDDDQRPRDQGRRRPQGFAMISRISRRSESLYTTVVSGFSMTHFFRITPWRSMRKNVLIAFIRRSWRIPYARIAFRSGKSLSSG